MRVVTDQLWFPEGPIALDDGSFLVVEIRRRTLTRVRQDGRVEVVAELGGGPNGAAIGPDGHCYVANNGGFRFTQRADGAWVTAGTPDDYTTGRVERVNIGTGAFDRLYDRVGDEPLRGPNDIVFDAHGGFWFTDPGKVRHRSMDRGKVCYASADGTLIREVISPIHKPNGIGLSPDGGLVEHVPVPGDTHCTNICFGGPDLRKAYITQSLAGRLIEMDWPRPGLRLFA